jgi:pentatricopeptide repeat protein
MLNYICIGNGERAAGYHAINLALHLANVVLAWFVALAIWNDALPAFFTTAIFALHPANVEAVTNIAGRPDLMAGLGVLGGLLFHIHSAGRRGPLVLIGIFSAALFGLFSKENAVILLPGMLLYDLAFRSKTEMRTLAPSYLSVVTALTIMVAVRAWLFARLASADLPFVDNPLVGAGFWIARLTAVQVIWRYVGLLLWPRFLSSDYSYNQIPMATVAIGLSALVGILVTGLILVSLRRRSRPAFFFGLFFFIAIAPTANVLFLIGTIMAERFLYLPSIGFAGCSVAATMFVAGRTVPRYVRFAAACFLSLAITGLALRTWSRNFEWTDGEKLWATARAVCPNSFKTHLAPIYGLSRQGLNLSNIDFAVREAETAVSIVNGLPPVQSTAIPLITLGTLYKIKGDLLFYQEPALVSDMYRKALSTLLSAVPLDRAYSQDRRARELARGWAPDQIPVKGNVNLYDNLADTYRRLGKFSEAIESLRHRLLIKPQNKEVYTQLADLEMALGRRDESIVWLWELVDLGAGSETEARIAAAYQSLDPTGCAVVGSRVNRNCPLVQSHLCSANNGLIRLFSESGKPVDAERLRHEAQSAGCKP